MIKRALGLFFEGGLGAGPRGAAEDDSEDEGLTAAQRRKLERRLIPGALEASTSAARGANERRAAPSEKARKGPKEEEEAQDEPEEPEEEDVAADADDAADDADDAEIKWGSDSGEDEEEEASDDDENPAMPAEAPKKFRGNFRCELCPDKILLNELDLEKHIQSAKHKRNEKRYVRAKEIGVEAFVKECAAKQEAEKANAGQGAAKRREKNDKYWAKQREKAAKKKHDTGAKPSGKDRAAKLSEAQIEREKERFQAKKARRLARRQASAEGSAEVAPQALAPAGGGRAPKRKSAAPEAAASAGKGRGGEREADAPKASVGAQAPSKSRRKDAEASGSPRQDGQPRAAKVKADAEGPATSGKKRKRDKGSA